MKNIIKKTLDIVKKITRWVPFIGVVQTADFNGLDLIGNIFKGIGKEVPHKNLWA